MQPRQLLTLARHTVADPAGDAVLLGRFADHRDPAAFEALMRRHGPMVWAACRHQLPDPADAEDCFQVVFLALARSAKSVRSPAALPGWLHGVTVRAAAKLRRSAARRRMREQRAAVTEADRPVPDSAWFDMLSAVHEELDELPAALRTAFVLCELEGVRPSDAADRLGWKPGTLSGRLTRARQQLLARLVRRGIAPAAAGGALGLAGTTGAGGLPIEVAGRVLEWTTLGPRSAPADLLKLVLEVTPVANRIKMFVAAGLVAVGLAAGVGSGLVPTADAQTTPPPRSTATPAKADKADAAAGPGAEGEGSEAGGMKYLYVDIMNPTPETRPEYEFVTLSADALRASSKNVRRVILERAKNGWQFAGAVPLFKGDDPAGTELVFSRSQPTVINWRGNGQGMGMIGMDNMGRKSLIAPDVRSPRPPEHYMNLNLNTTQLSAEQLKLAMEQMQQQIAELNVLKKSFGREPFKEPANRITPESNLREPHTRPIAHDHAVALARVQVEKAKATVELAKSESERVEALRMQGVNHGASIDEARYKLRLAELELQESELRLRMIEDQPANPRPSADPLLQNLPRP